MPAHDRFGPLSESGSKPPVVLMPIIGGGLNGITKAPVIPAPNLPMADTTPKEESSCVLRSFHGINEINDAMELLFMVLLRIS